MLKTRVAHGYCSRQLAAEACPYANICEQCDNYVTAPEFIPQLQAQLADMVSAPATPRGTAAPAPWEVRETLSWGERANPARDSGRLV